MLWNSLVASLAQYRWQCVHLNWFLPLGLSGWRGIVIACVCVSTCILYFVCTISLHRFELESTNLHQRCILGHCQLVLKMGSLTLTFKVKVIFPSRPKIWGNLVCNVALVYWSRPAKGCNIDGLVQDCSNSIANALELVQSCTEPSTCSCFHFDGLMQERRNSIANALELRLPCTNPSIWYQDKSCWPVVLFILQTWRVELGVFQLRKRQSWRNWLPGVPTRKALSTWQYNSTWHKNNWKAWLTLTWGRIWRSSAYTMMTMTMPCQW